MLYSAHATNLHPQLENQETRLVLPSLLRSVTSKLGTAEARKKFQRHLPYSNSH